MQKQFNMTDGGHLYNPYIFLRIAIQCPSLLKFLVHLMSPRRRHRDQNRNSNTQDAQLSQRDRAAGCVIVFAKRRTLEL